MTIDDIDFGGAPDGLGASTCYNPNRGSWMALVFRKEGKDVEVLAVGFEADEKAIDRWALGTIRLIIETGCDDAELPDMNARKTLH